MRSATFAATAAALGMVIEAVLCQPAATVLTVPQRDRVRTQLFGPTAAVSAAGRHIAFSSYERLDGADTDTLADIYVIDRDTGAVSLESAAIDGRPVVADCLRPRISGDGRYLVFESVAARDHDDRVIPNVVLRDRAAGLTRPLSPGWSGVPPNGWSGAAAISADGSTIAFESTATNLVAGADANGAATDVFLFDVRSGAVRRVNVDALGLQPASGTATAPAVSADGRHVAFAATADLTAPGPGSPPIGTGTRPPAIYVRDMQLNVTSRIAPPGGHDGASLDPAISSDGRYVAFVSYAPNLTPGDRNRAPDVFVYDMSSRATILVSRSAGGGTANGASRSPAISGDGRYVAFQSEASDLICARRCDAAPEDINLLADVFLFDRIGRSVAWISGSAEAGWLEESGGPALDAAGQVVAFASRHPMDAADLAHDFDLFVRVGAPAATAQGESPRASAGRAGQAAGESRAGLRDRQR